MGNGSRKENEMNTRKLVFSSVFISLGIIIPQLFHLIGGPMLGGVLLPMHLPVIAAGMLCGPLVGVITGLFSPLLSSAITGMPPVPRLWFMMVELGVYGWVAGMLYYQLRKNIYVSLLSAMVAGRVVYGLLIAIVVPLFGITLPGSFSVTAAVAQGMPGIMIQIVLLPVTIIMLERNIFRNESINRPQTTT